MKSKSKNVKVTAFLASIIFVASASVIFSSAAGPSDESLTFKVTAEPSIRYSRDDLDQMFSEIDSIVDRVKSSNTSNLKQKREINNANELFDKLKALNQRCNQLEDIFNVEVSKYKAIQQKLNQVDAERRKAEEEVILAEKILSDKSLAKAASRSKLKNKFEKDINEKKESLKTILENFSALQEENKLCEANINKYEEEIYKMQQENSLITEKIKKLVNYGI